MTPSVSNTVELARRIARLDLVIAGCVIIVLTDVTIIANGSTIVWADVITRSSLLA